MANSHKNVAQADAHAPAVHASTHNAGGSDAMTNPQFTTIELGAASDTTIARASAGNLTVEGNALYRAGGTDVPVTDGGTGASSAATARSNLGVTTIATDTIWDAAGDLAVGSGADTAAKLVLGAAGGAVSRVNGAVAWNSGTSMPTAATGDRYWRTDLGMEFYYDGTRWLSVDLHQLPVAQSDVLNGYTTGPGTQRAPVPVWGGSDIYLVSTQTWFYVAGGTALGASHKWVGTFTKQPGGVTLDTVNIDSGASDTYRQSTATAVNALLATTNFLFLMSWAITGTPGTLYTQSVVSFRYVST